MTVVAPVCPVAPLAENEETDEDPKPMVWLLLFVLPLARGLRTTKYRVYAAGRFRIGYSALLCA
jgi:hypothetical protein